MRSERDRMDENSPLMYHIHLVELLAVCTEGKNVYTEIKCNSLLPLDDIVRVVTHEDCIPEVRAVRRHWPMCIWNVLVLGERDSVFPSLTWERCRGTVSCELANWIPSLVLLSATPANPDSSVKSFYTCFLALKMGMWCCTCLFYRVLEAERFMECAANLEQMVLQNWKWLFCWRFVYSDPGVFYWMMSCYSWH